MATPVIALADPHTLTKHRERVRTVCQSLLASGQYDAQDARARELAASALAAFSESGLLNLPFLDTGRIGKGDMHTLAATLGTLAAHSHTLMSVFLINAVFGGVALAFFGSPAQKKQLLPAVRAGKSQMAFALTEPEAGSDAAAVSTSYERRAEGYVLNGVKQFTTGADVADHLLIVAKAHHASGTRPELTLFIVPRHGNGVTVQPLPKLAGNLHASCQVTLEGLHAGDDSVLGGREGVGTAWAMLRYMGLIERFCVAAVSAGLASAATERALEYACERRQFGQRISEFQAVQFPLVDMKTAERLMRLLVAEAAEKLESGADATFEVTTAKAYCAETLQTVVASGMRVMGGRAYFDFEPMSRFYREAPWVLYAGGTVEIQKRLAARAIGLA